MSAMDIVFIEDLRIDAIIGIFDWERAVPQEIIVNLEMATDIAKPAATTDVKDALDYSHVCRRVSEHIVSAKYLLLETLVEETASLIMKEFGVVWLAFQAAKTQAMPNTKSVGLRIERGVRPASQRAS